MEDPVPYEPLPPRSSKLTQLTTVAIILIVVAGLSWFYSAADVAVRVWNLSRGVMPAPPPGAPGFVAGFKAAMYIFIVVGSLSLILSPVMIAGAAQMLRRKTLGFAKFAAILAMLPITTNCCCLVTLPLGIWAMILLASPEVAETFK